MFVRELVAGAIMAAVEQRISSQFDLLAMQLIADRTASAAGIEIRHERVRYGSGEAVIEKEGAVIGAVAVVRCRGRRSGEDEHLRVAVDPPAVARDLPRDLRSHSGIVEAFGVSRCISHNTADGTALP